MTQRPTPRSLPSAPPPPARPASSFWAIVAGGASGLLIGGVAMGSVVRNRGGGELEQRLSALEEKISALDQRRGAPAFVVDPAAPADRVAISQAVAALSQELADLRAHVGVDRDRSPREMAASEDAGTRRRSIRQLRELARTDPEARALLSRLLRDPDPRVRREALDALADLGDPAALGEIAGLLGDQDPRMRERVARRVGDLAGKANDPAERARAMQALDPLLADENASVRQQAVEALRKLGKEAVPSLTRALADKNFEVQEKAIEALERAGDPQAIASLRQTYGDGSGPNALEAALALKKLGDPSAFQKEAERLRAVLQEPGGSEDKREALRLLVQHNPHEARALIDRAMRDPSEAMRREAQRLLERMRR